MNVLWRSVVGKLWMTIIALVTVVLSILTLLLVQFFDGYYNEQQEEHLLHLATKISSIYQTYEFQSQAFYIVQELVEVSETMLTVSGPNPRELWYVSAHKELPFIRVEDLEKHHQLENVLRGESITIRDQFPVVNQDEEKKELDVIMVAVPIMDDDKQPIGAVFLYQTLDVINETVNATKRIILYSAGIGILLTTIFAFFLSTRITYPLRQMKDAAGNMAKGDFQSTVDIRSRDEIGELAYTFNYMASDLETSIQALSHEKENLSSILRSMVDGVVTLDVEGKIILMNPPAERILQEWRYEENRHHDSNGLPKRFWDVFQHVIQTEKEHTQTVSAQGRFWTIVVAPLYNQEKIRGTVAVIRDMTEEKRLDKLRKDFVANVSHELRTPISMLQGYSEALIDDVVVSKEERKELVQIIHDESLRMGRLVNELLDLAKMETGHVDLEKNGVPLDVVIQKSIRKFINMAKDEHVKLIDNIEAITHTYVLDYDRLEQIFTNLIDNAIRHTPLGGNVTVSLTEDSKGAKISIKDTGSGIPEEDLPFVFERFYKADKARTRGKAGTGIGLSIVKHLVEAHEGQIDVHSREGVGTTFTIWLPNDQQYDF